ncbi:MAG TPA: zinc-binding dehydrogenase [Vicinamibacterales bacterium]|nr:zinc-binding dehydrogenase [Vicinamibacterales bacterium]
MHAIQLVETGAPVQLREIPTPEPAPGEVRVRVRAAGICHSDAHYRAGRSPTSVPPLTLGHEVAGTIDAAGARVRHARPGSRVCVHYLIACGDCWHCSRGHEQFCTTGSMIGHHRDGGWAEYIVVPERNAVPLPDEISFEHGAALMCSSATALHALRRGRLAGGETVAVFGCGGLGLSAVQLARALGALDVYGVDLDADKLHVAESMGATPIDASAGDAADAIRAHTGGRGVDVAIEVVGLPATMSQAVRCLAIHGRAVIVGLADRPLVVDSYRDLLGREAAVLGANDHLLQELPQLIEYARRGALDLSRVVTRSVPLEAIAVNRVLDELDRFGAPARTVIIP